MPTGQTQVVASGDDNRHEGQPEHALASETPPGPTPKYPARQRWGQASAAPPASAYVPFAHGSHAPSELANRPTPHCWHVPFPTKTLSTPHKRRVDTHVLCDVAPTVVLYVPGPHAVQRSLAGSVSVPAYVFAGHRHASMLPAPVPVLLESRGHVTHACMLVAPDAVLNVFGGHCVHAAAPITPTK